MQHSLFVNEPRPDFGELERILRGEEEPRRVHPVEHLIDEEVLQAVTERYLGAHWLSDSEGDEESRLRQTVEVHYRLGYDCFTVFARYANHPPVAKRRAADTAELTRGERTWVDESRGLIASWEDLERFPWKEIRPDNSALELVARHLPPGMKVTVAGEIFEHVLEDLLGYEGLCYLLYDDPELVGETFARWGAKVYEYYQSVIGLDHVGAIFHSDDLGYKTSTLLSLAALRRHVLPWFRKYAALAHEHGKMFWLHSCGNLFPDPMEDLINDVQVDAIHSFQDVILPVGEFKARYGRRIAAMGGVDVDALARLDEAPLRAYIREVLAQCMPGGRFALGSGNTIANYVPLRNYLILLEEGQRWRP